MNEYVGNMREYVGNMKQNVDNMKKYVGNVQKYVENMKSCVENMWKMYEWDREELRALPSPLCIGSETWKNSELFLGFGTEKIPGSPPSSSVGRRRSIERSKVRVCDVKHDLYFILFSFFQYKECGYSGKLSYENIIQLRTCEICLEIFMKIMSR